MTPAQMSVRFWIEEAQRTLEISSLHMAQTYMQWALDQLNERQAQGAA